MTEYTFIVTVSGCSAEDARTVMAERICPDEDYGFDYEIGFTSAALPCDITEAQRRAIEHYKGYEMPATWFVGEPDERGNVEAIALGGDFVWSFLVEPDGTAHGSQAPLGDFTTGIEM